MDTKLRLSLEKENQEFQFLYDWMTGMGLEAKKLELNSAGRAYEQSAKRLFIAAAKSGILLKTGKPSLDFSNLGNTQEPQYLNTITPDYPQDFQHHIYKQINPVS